MEWTSVVEVDVKQVAKTQQGAVATVECAGKRFYQLQYHQKQFAFLHPSKHRFKHAQFHFEQLEYLTQKIQNKVTQCCSPEILDNGMCSTPSHLFKVICNYWEKIIEEKGHDDQ
ncbi:hypothetical protein CTI12_AA295570 [Artemisia annua]|uniref:Uncharacterized protein n=1 Tax=Artemisia annua TaxID=35608 RepID=A0A2U1N833_ARTAN|nr:hypothetical protein CTI12_AA295570 [Artemisia annua]